MKIFCRSVPDGLRRRVGGRRVFPCVRVAASFSGLCVSGSVPFADRSRTGRMRSAWRHFPGKGERGDSRFPTRACEASGVLGGCDRRERSGRLGAGGDTDRSEKRCCVQPLRPAGKVGARRTVLSVCGAGPGIRASSCFAGRGRREKYGFASCYAPERNAGTRCRRKRALS